MHENATRLQRGWNLLVAAGAVIAAIVIPVRLVLDDPARIGMTLLDWALTILFLVDLILKLHRLGGWKVLSSSDASKAVPGYTWWLIAMDLCAAIPFAAFSNAPLLRLLRLLKLSRVAEQMWRWRRAESYNPNVIRLVLFFFWLMLTAHWIACGWLALHGLSEDLDQAMNYVRALYWGVTTLTTVGYGDITPSSMAETIYAMLVMVLGVGVYGYVIGNVAGLVTNIDPARVRHREVVDKVIAFIRYRKVPPRLQRRILDYYQYLWEKRLGYDESAVVMGFPPTLRTEVSLFLNRDIIQKVPLFHGASGDFVKSVALEMRPIIFMPGDYIIRAGETGDEMYFISRGTVEVVSADDAEVYAALTAGQFFGEIALLFEEPRTFSVRAVDYCDLYMLNRSSLKKVLVRHADVADHLKAIAEKRLEENRRRQNRDARGDPEHN